MTVVKGGESSSKAVVPNRCAVRGLQVCRERFWKKLFREVEFCGFST